MLCPQSCPLCWMYFRQYELDWADCGKGTTVSCEKGSREGGLTHTVCCNISTSLDCAHFSYTIITIPPKLSYHKDCWLWWYTGKILACNVSSAIWLSLSGTLEDHCQVLLTSLLVWRYWDYSWTVVSTLHKNMLHKVGIYSGRLIPVMSKVRTFTVTLETTML